MLQIEVERSVLLKALNRVKYSYKKKTSLPVLGNVLLSSDEDGKVSLQTTNMTVVVRAIVEAKMINVGQITTGHKDFAAAVKSMPKDSVLIIKQELGSKVSVSDSMRTFELSGIHADEFPKVDWFDMDNDDYAISLSIESLVKSVDKTQRAMSSDDARPILTGMLFHSNRDMLNLVCTSGFEFVSSPVKTDQIKDKFRIVVAGEAVRVISKVLRGEGQIKIFYTGSNTMCFVTDELSIMAYLEPGNFPDMQQAISDTENPEFSFEINHRKFLEELQRSNVIARYAAGMIRIQVSKDSGLVLYAEANEQGKFSAKLSINNMQINKDIGEIAFSANRANGLLSSSASFDKKDDVMRISWRSRDKDKIYPILFENVTQGDGAKYILQPVVLSAR